MSEPIKVGDLVVMVQGCPGCDCWPIGRPFTVARFSTKSVKCQGKDVGMGGAQGLEDYTIPLKWLKRIPPLSELEDVKQDQEITA